MNIASLGDTLYFPQNVAEEHYAVLGTAPEISEMKKHSWYSIHWQQLTHLFQL